MPDFGILDLNCCHINTAFDYLSLAIVEIVVWNFPYFLESLKIILCAMQLLIAQDFFYEMLHLVNIAASIVY